MPGKKPTNLKLLEGNRGKRPLPENEPKPRPVAPECPADLDAGAKRAWKRLAPKLEKIGLLTEVDGDMFAEMVQLRSRLETIHRRQKQVDKLIKQAEKAMDFERLESLKGETGWLYKEERLYAQQFRQYASEFGLTPKGRVGLSITGSDDDEDGIGKFLD